MAQAPLQDVRDQYDVIVVGAGLGGLTAANTLARSGRSVLLLEQHSKLGGLATWFQRPGGHIFDVALHGFPVGMIKSCRRYWSREIADSIVQLKNIRFDNPMFSLSTTFDREDFTRLLVERFGVARETVGRFFDTARDMKFYDDQSLTTGQLFERFFPGREDVVRLLMEPITYANGSTLEDPALSYGIVFSNFMSKGVYTFQGGTDRLMQLMEAELRRNGVDVRTRRASRGSRPRAARAGVVAGGRTINARAVVSNANLKATIFHLVGEASWDPDFLEQARAVRLNNSSTQVYMALRPDEMIDEARLRRPAVQFHGPGVPQRVAPEPRRHEPDVLVLLPQDPAGAEPLPDRREHERPLRRLGRPVETGLPGREMRPGREHARRGGQVRARHPREAGVGRMRDALDLRALHAAPRRRQFRDEVRGPGRQPRDARADCRALPHRQRGHYHVRMARGGQLRRHCGERSGQLPDEGGRRRAEGEGSSKPFPSVASGKQPQ